MQGKQHQRRKSSDTDVLDDQPAEHVMTIDQLREAMAKTNAAVTDEQVRMRWEELDVNGDGTVSKKEFLHAEAFAAIEVDGSGDIGIEELRAAMRRDNTQVTEEAVQKRWGELDGNRDGSISKEEFLQAALAADREGGRQAASRQAQHIQALNQGGAALAERFALACGRKAPDDVFEAAGMFRRLKAREFWWYLLFLVLFSASTLLQRPVEQTHDLIADVVDATVMGNGFTSVPYLKTLEDVGSIEDFWGFLTEVTPQYLYQYTAANGSRFGADFQGTGWRVLHFNNIVQPVRLRQVACVCVCVCVCACVCVCVGGWL